MRSNDIYFGLRNDLYCFAQMQKRLASELNVSLGDYIHISNSLHIYESQYKKLEALIK
jgi:thymidylate synthase